MRKIESKYFFIFCLFLLLINFLHKAYSGIFLKKLLLYKWDSIFYADLLPGKVYDRKNKEHIGVDQKLYKGKNAMKIGAFYLVLSITLLILTMITLLYANF